MSARRHRITAENALLISATRLDRDPPPGIGVAVLDWSYLCRAADRQGVAPLLYDWLRAHPEVHVDEVAREALHEAYWSGHFRNRLLLEELSRVAHAAAAEGIELMPLKGAQLAPGFYHTPALRPLSDLDLLVHPRDVRPLGTLLRSLGYAEVNHAPSYVDEEQLELDSRDYGWFQSRQGFDALVEYRVAPLELAVGRLTDLDPTYTEALRQHAREVWTRATVSADGTMREQSPEDLLLHVTTHMAAKHVHFRLIWLHDVARIIERVPDLDWAYLVARSADLRMAAPVGVALEAARRYAGAAIDAAHVAEVVATLGPASRLSLAHRELAHLREHVEAMTRHDLTPDGPGIWPVGAALSRVRGWRARLRLVRWVLLPGHAYLTHRGTDGEGPLGRIAGSAKRLARRGRRRAAPHD